MGRDVTQVSPGLGAGPGAASRRYQGGSPVSWTAGQAPSEHLRWVAV